MAAYCVKETTLVPSRYVSSTSESCGQRKRGRPFWMRAASSHLFVPELRNVQTDRVLEPRGHYPPVTPMWIRRRLLKTQQCWHRLTSESLHLRKNLVWVERTENLQVEPAILSLRH
jgi:hypothetical protein